MQSTPEKKRSRSPSLNDQLPESLPLVIFSFLSFRDIFRMRAVCRLWKDLLCSDDFAKTWKALEKSSVFSQATYRESWAYHAFMERNSDGFISDTDDEEFEDVMEQWLEVWNPASAVRRKFSTAGLPPLHPPFCPCMTGLLQRPVDGRVPFEGDPCFTVLASGEGLVCGHLKEEPGYVLAVGNPLTCAWKKLPSVLHPPLLPENSRLCALMLVDTSTYSYMVALFPRERRPPHEAWSYHPLTYEAKDEPFWLLIFDSRADRWEFAPPFKWSSLSCHTNCSTPPYSSIPFFFPLPPSRSSSKYFRIAAFDIATRLWSAVAEA